MKPRTAQRVSMALLVGVLLLALISIHPGSGVTTAGSALAARVTSQRYKPGEILVKFTPGLSAQSQPALQALAQAGAVRTDTIEALDVERWQVPVGREELLAGDLNGLPGVEYAEPNYAVRMQLVPDDTYYDTYQWPHPLINSPLAWDLTTSTSTIVVAVLDTGVDMDHPEFAGKLTTGYDYVNDDGYPDDDHGHGTHVAGIAAAIGNNAQGVAGMAWQTRIMPLKVLDGNGGGWAADTAEAIEDATQYGANIVNVSLGGVDDSQTLENAVKYAYNRDVLIVAAAGNCGGTNYLQNGCTYQDQPLYPAAYDTEVFAVAATTSYDSYASFSSRGVYVDIAAPGLGIYSTYPDSLLPVSISGTSQATPHVAGLAALLLALDPALTPEEIQAHIEAGAVDLGPTGWDPDYGVGRIDAFAALLSHQGLDAPDLLAIDNADRNGAYLVDWSSVTYAAGYMLEEDDNGAFSSPEIVYSGANSYAAITGQDDGTWHCRVRATRESAGLISGWSDSESVTVGLDAPSLHPIDNGGADSYTISWDSVTAASAYSLQEAASADFAGATDIYTGTGLSHAVTGRDGGTWYYRVQATLGAVGSPWSDTQSATVVPDPPLLDPIAPGVDPDSYTLTWSGSTGADDYRLQESPDLAFSSVITRYIGATAGYTVTGQPTGTRHYRVEAGNSAGWGLPSNTQSFTVTVDPIPAPMLYPIPVPDTVGTYTVTWTSILTATGYILEECPSAWFDTAVISYMTPLTEHNAVSRPPGAWHYRVRAQTPVGDSPWSQTESVTVTAYVYLPLVMR